MEYLGHNVIIRLIITAINRTLFLMKFPKRSLPVVLPQSHVLRMAMALMLMELSCLKPEHTSPEKHPGSKGRLYKNERILCRVSVDY